MRIAIITETLHAGGAETFVVRLANALSQNHEVAVVNFYPELSRQQLMDQLASKVELVNVRFFGKNIFRKIDRALFYSKIDFSVVQYLLVRRLRLFVKHWNPNVIHSHLFKTDYYTSLLPVSSKNYKHVITNHGDYLLFDQKSPVGILNYLKKLKFTFSSINETVVISDIQLQWVQNIIGTYGFSSTIHKILNGYSAGMDYEEKDDSRAAINLEAEDFVFGMVSRGIKEKGWHNLIRAFKQVAIPNKKLVLVGAGEEIDLLKTQYKLDSSILFVGYSANPLLYIRTFDVCLLPSYYQAESLPTVIIEYLLCEKPIITTNTGEIKNMLSTPSGQFAGIFVNHLETGVDEVALSQSMIYLYEHSDRRELLKKLASEAFQKFNMDQCVKAYLEVYKA